MQDPQTSLHSGFGARSMATDALAGITGAQIARTVPASTSLWRIQP